MKVSCLSSNNQTPISDLGPVFSINVIIAIAIPRFLAHCSIPAVVVIFVVIVIIHLFLHLICQEQQVTTQAKI